LETTTPVFICPACGSYCENSWEEVDPWDDPPSLASLVGLVQLAAARHYPLRPLCLHPDGTGEYGGAEVGNLKGTIHSLTSDEAEEILVSAEPLAHALPLEVLEERALSGMAGLLAEQGLWPVSPDMYPDEFFWIYYRLANLPETSEFASVFAEGDPALRRLQDIVLGILEHEEALREVLYDAVIEAKVFYT